MCMCENDKQDVYRYRCEVVKDMSRYNRLQDTDLSIVGLIRNNMLSIIMEIEIDIGLKEI